MKIAVFGTVGAGKTKVSDELCQQLNYDLFKEPLEENPYFNDFYQDMAGFAFKMQIYMLTTRIEQYFNIDNYDNTIFDRTILEDPVFVRVSHLLNIMNETDFKVYNRFFQNVIIPILKQKLGFDVIIYLKVSTAKAVERIKQRGRQLELETPYHYWEKLNEQYEVLYHELKKDYKFIVVDADNDDFSEKINVIMQNLLTLDNKISCLI
ncbi:deoxynucleoside kinase [Spiroplasma endosymbiont of Polydrusus pterygomalis]|uniref:deoxynucleoside kinase n=1 Tax=Spiroplasma endosymbiont of Polydrusus pterygomalis TaxID=3139327 RepID=UPI003CCA8B66